MAQTRRKRQTKHRGNAAGVVEARGRTGRPPSPDERKKANRAKAREARLNTPPTWAQSAKRAALAGVFMFIFLYVTNHTKTGDSRLISAALFAIVAMVLYVPGGYYLESYLYRRRIARKQVGQSGAKR